MKYFISFADHPLIQMVDWWAFLCEFDTKEDYASWVYDETYKYPFKGAI